MFATVEEFNRGHATVRLAEKGARMTNIPVLTATVEPGERVILDYSAEGQPYVRPLTALPTIPDELDDAISGPEGYEDTGLIACRLSKRSPMTFPIYWVYGWGVTPSRKAMNWDTVEWETQPGLCQWIDSSYKEGYVFVAPEDGKYIYRWAIGVNQCGYTYGSGNILAQSYLIYSTGINFFDLGGMCHTRFGGAPWTDGPPGAETYVVGGTGIAHLAEGWTVGISLDIEPGGMVSRPNATVPVSQGRYPILDIWKVSQTAPYLEATYDYVYGPWM